MASIVIVGDTMSEIPELKGIIDDLLKGKISITNFMKFLEDNNLEPELVRVGEENHEEEFDSDGDTKEAVAADLFKRLGEIRKIYRRESYKNKAYKVPFTTNSIIEFMKLLELPTEKIEKSLDECRRYYYTHKRYTSWDEFESDMRNEFGIKDLNGPLPNKTPEWIPELINRVKIEHLKLYTSTPLYHEYLFEEILKNFHNWTPVEILGINELRAKKNTKALEEILNSVKAKKGVNVSKLFSEVMNEKPKTRQDVEKFMKDQHEELKSIFEEIINSKESFDSSELVYYNNLCMDGCKKELESILESLTKPKTVKATTSSSKKSRSTSSTSKTKKSTEK